MQKGQSQVDYDTNVKPLQFLIDKNDSLIAAYRTLAQVSGEEADQTRATIAQLADSAFLQSLTTWHDTLCGQASQTGLIAAWNNRVRYLHAPLFEQASAQEIQDHWDNFDAHQALSINFLVHHYYDTNQPTLARDAIATWLNNRKVQLGLLRACARASETVYNFDPASCQLTSSALALNAFPPMAICHFLENQWWMWSLRVGDGQFLQVSPDAHPNCNQAAAAATQAAGQSFPWQFVPNHAAEAFVTVCGGQVGSGYAGLGSGAAEHWKSQLTAKGFVFPPGRPGDFMYSFGGFSYAGWTWLIFGEGLPRSQMDGAGLSEEWNEFIARFGGTRSLSASVPVAFALNAEQAARYWWE